MRRLALALLLAGGCSPAVQAYLSPVGPSYCVTSEGGEVLDASAVEALDEARDRAVAYWDAAGLRLDSRCGGTARLLVYPQPAGVRAVTFTGGGHLPVTALDPGVLSEARAGSDRSWETVAHELGHALGLGHSPDPSSVMWPTGHGLPDVPAQADVDAAAYLMAAGGF